MKLLFSRSPALSGGLILLSFLFIFSSLFHLLPRPDGPVPAFFPAAGPVPATVVLDPGHGGEDGGASAQDGTKESGINLEISLRLQDMLYLMGQPAILTRRSDAALGDPELETIRQRKASDIRRRVELVNSTPGAVLVSIHQNSLPSSPVTRGAQVFWNRQAGGQDLAEAMQSALNEVVNAGNAKRAREMDSTVYLMRHAEVPAALAECGFLSNREEAALLQTADHQREIAAAVAAGILRYLREEIR
ncbi:MAG: N-acetylmuramoyl-L-alanine amidase [Oscillibacter sp.]|nr:N-acetylmuramoyl-L-alanine amidase [Oscillibacter sp.]